MNKFVIRYEKENNSLIYIFVSSIIITLSSNIFGETLNAYIALALTAIGCLINPIIPICIKLLITMESIELITLVDYGMWFLSIIPYLFSKGTGIKQKDAFFLAACLVVFTLSFVFGIDSGYMQIFFQMMLMITVLIIKNASEKDVKLIFYTAIIAGVLVTIITAIGYFRGTAVYHVYRLTYDDSVRTLGNCIAFSTVFYAYKTINQDPNTKNRKVADIVLFLFCIGVSLLSYSRGSILAVVVAIIYLVLKKLQKPSFGKIAGVILFGIGFFVVVNYLELNFEKLNNIKTGYDRIEIWSYYIKRIFDGGFKTITFGFGPGDLKRLTVGTLYQYYAHSTILDYFFSYGILGIILVLYMMISSVRNTFYKKSILTSAIFILTVLLFIPFGSRNNYIFHVFIGISLSSVMLSPPQIREDLTDNKYTRESII